MYFEYCEIFNKKIYKIIKFVIIKCPELYQDILLEE